MLIDITTFRLVDAADERAFLAADRRVQTEAVPTRPGFLRRTTARSATGEWAVIVLWGSAAEADAAAAGVAAHPAVVELEALVDASTVRRERYETLD